MPEFQHGAHIVQERSNYAYAAGLALFLRSSNETFTGGTVWGASGPGARVVSCGAELIMRGGPGTKSRMTEVIELAGLAFSWAPCGGRKTIVSLK